MKERLAFIDWMKVIGIYLIVCGHFTQPRPPFVNYIYVFSVPMFFAISGFLFRKETDTVLFWKKLTKNLLLPMLGICFFLWCYDCFLWTIRHSSPPVWSEIWVRCRNILIGFQGDSHGNGLQVCWFIYTLAFLKILMQYIPLRMLQLFVMPLGLAVVVIVSMQNPGFHCNNAIAVSALCFPFFLLGYAAKKWIFLENVTGNAHKYVLWLLMSLGITVLIGYYNSPTWVFQCQYGRDCTLFLLGGMSGTLCVYVISLLLSSYSPKILKTLSSGTIIILGFHQITFHVIYNLPYVHQYPALYYVAGVFVIILFYPIILLTGKVLPFLLGGRKVE